MRGLRLLALLFAVTFVAAACGDLADTTTTTAGPEATTPTAQPPATTQPPPTTQPPATTQAPTTTTTVPPTTTLPPTTTTTAGFPVITFQIAPPCDLLTQQFTPEQVTWLPPHTEGDRDFKGHGPDVTATVTMEFQHDTAWVTVYMKARETEPDFTTAEGTSDIHVIYQAPGGWLIHEFFAESAESVEYRDDGHFLDVFPGQSLVNEWMFRGDGFGDDAGLSTSVRIDFRRLQVLLIEDANCIPPGPIRP